MLDRIDLFLLQKAQKFSDWFQVLTGLTKYRLEQWMLSLLLTSFTISTVLLIWEDTFSLILMAPAMLLVPVCVYQVRDIGKQEREFLRKGQISISIFQPDGPRKITLLTCLWSALGILVLTSVPVFGLKTGKTFYYLDLATAIFCILWVYFSVCIPRPSGRSKVREGFKKGMAWLKHTLAPEPVPVPTG